MKAEKTTPVSPAPAATEMERPSFADAEMRGQKKGILLGVGVCLSVIVLLGTGIVIGRFILDRTGTSTSKGFPDLPPPPPFPLASQAKGQVVTAGGLMETRIFGAEAEEHGRSVAAIQERVEMYLPKLREAYAKELIPHPHLMGIFVLEMTIAPDGHVSQILSHPTYISSREFQRAVENLVQDWHFDPASTGEVNVFYPLLFIPAEIDPQMIAGFVKWKRLSPSSS